VCGCRVGSCIAERTEAGFLPGDCRKPGAGDAGAVFFYLPSMLLSGFMFPFQGMPSWAQALGEVLPLTHLVRAARAALLKGQDGSIVVHEIWPIGFFGLVAAALALAAYRRRLD
jgi:ABC-2 type transport system permease protein